MFGKRGLAMQHWYVAACKTNQEDRAQENLGRLMYEVYCPVLRQEVINKDNKTIKTTLLFPGYIFVRFDPTVQSASVINHSMGVRKLITFGDVLVPMDSSIVESIKSRTDGIIPAPKPRTFANGDTFKITGECFNGLDAVFVEPIGTNRSLILLSLLGSKQPVTVDNRYIA